MFVRFLPVLLCVLSLALSGCTPRSRYQVENFFDDLGRSISQTTRRLTGEDQGSRRPVRSSRTQPQSQGQSPNALTLKVLQTSLKPVSVHPGDKVQVVLRYSISGAPSQGIALQQKSILLQDGKELAVLKEEGSTKEDGEWEDTLSFVVPSSAKAGKYMVTMRISGQGQSRSVQRSFTVL